MLMATRACLVRIVQKHNLPFLDVPLLVIQRTENAKHAVFATVLHTKSQIAQRTKIQNVGNAKFVTQENTLS